MRRDIYSDQVRRSRAGDEFHYRWAARRCLELINPKTSLDWVRIESSDDPEIAGECVIDVSEYSTCNNTKKFQVSYYQLKHSTLSKLKNLTYSELKKTFQGFAERYKNDSISNKIQNSYFYIITNRFISQKLKKEIECIKVNKKIKKNGYAVKIKKDTFLEEDEVIGFCSNLHMLDGESDYVKQKSILRYELSNYFDSPVDIEVNQLVTLIRENALPDKDGKITKEDVLRILGVSSVDALFPAPSEFEQLKNYVVCKKHQQIAEFILSQEGFFIVTADGGVGKSTFTNHFIHHLPEYSVGVAYDCFGGGSYRNPAKLRHKANKALVQIVNQLAEKGLCKYLLPVRGHEEDYYYHNFLKCISHVVREIKKVHDDGKLFILIDAADNAEILAKERNESCFANNLFKIELPQGCCLVMLCRPYRKKLIDPSNEVKVLTLDSFSLDETRLHLMNFYENVSIVEAEEMHRLTGGNPRVQATVFSKHPESLSSALESLGSNVKSVGELLAKQLSDSILKLYRIHGNQYKEEIELVCRGLSVLPPSVPVNVLEHIAGVSSSLIRSFVSDIEGMLFIAKDNIQFKDEPTETWFREKYSSSPETLKNFVEKLRPIAHDNGYVARVIPQLLFKAECYEELFSIAVSDNYLPEGNNIDEQNIRTDLLNFSFRTALKMKRWKEAVQIAIRAGEESSNNTKLDELISSNIDIVNIIKDKQTLQNWAFTRRFSSSWKGSEHLYSAILFSVVDGFDGFARNSLRSTENWIRIALDHRNREREEKRFGITSFGEDDLVKLAFLHYNLDGFRKVAYFLRSWSPPRLMIKVAERFVSSLIDHGKFDDINRIADFLNKEVHLILGINAALVKVCCFLPKYILENSFRVLISRKKPFPKLERLSGNCLDYSFSESFVSFAESCAYHKFPSEKIIKILDYYFPKYFEEYWGGATHEKDRELASRVVALKNVLEGDFSINYKKYIDEKSFEESKKSWAELKSALDHLLPYYLRRACLLVHESLSDKPYLDVNLHNVSYISNSFIKHEVLCVYSQELVFRTDLSEVEKNEFLNKLFIKHSAYFFLNDRINLLRKVFRSSTSSIEFRKKIEKDCYLHLLECERKDTVESYSDSIIQMARAVLSRSSDKAYAYFQKALERLSKFGDETLSRWNAVQSIAKNISIGRGTNSETAYRYMRCASALAQHSGYGDYMYINNTIRICVGLHFSSACATISRWLDRNMYLFGDLIEPLADEAVLRNFIPPRTGFSLTGFKGCNASPSFLKTCLIKEKDVTIQQLMLDETIRDISIDEPDKLYKWEALNALSSDFSLNFSDAIYFGAVYHKREKDQTYENNWSPEKNSWSYIFKNSDVNTSEGIRIAKNRAKETDCLLDVHFWTNLISRVSYGKEAIFLKNISKDNEIDIYDIKNIISVVKEKWENNVLVEDIWPDFLKAIGFRFSYYFISGGQERLSTWELHLNKSEITHIINSAISGTADFNHLDAEVYYGFVTLGVDLVEDKDVHDLFEYSLSRIEKQVDSSFEDGTWNDSSIPPHDNLDSLMGVVWIALGSPDSSIRWQAAHCVCRLAKYKCREAFNFLYHRLENGALSTFFSKDHPFYILHAKLYLLIAYARIAEENSDLLVPYDRLFEKYALSDIPHALIQYISSSIALYIERDFPGTYCSNSIRRFKGNSGILSNDTFIERSTQTVAKNSSTSKSSLIYGDFLWYWFPYLQTMFDYRDEHLDLHSLATFLAETKLNLEDNRNLVSDSRWANSYGLMQHSHGSYPHIDRYDFYYSYHSYMCTAAFLHSCKSIRKTKWREWLKSHLLQNRTNFWLADRRDPIPPCALLSNKKLQKENVDIGLDAYCVKIFTDSFPEKAGNFITIGGYWSSSYENNFYETIRISSALISPDCTYKLMEIMSKSTKLYEYILPLYKEENLLNFPLLNGGKIKGWLQSFDSEGGIDEFDLYGGKIYFPPMQLHSSFIDTLKLIPDEKRRYWRFANQNDKSIISQLWSKENKYDRESRSFTRGKRLIATLSVLQKFCQKLEMDIIISVLVERNEKYYRNKERRRHYLERIFVVESDGRVRGTNGEIF